MHQTVIDLTMPIRAGDGRFGNTNQFFDEPHTFERDGLQSSTFKMFAHFGTHVDAPRHIIRDGQTIDGVPLERLMGRGAVFDLFNLPDSSPIGSEMLTDRDPGLQLNDIAILRTDWTDRKWGQPEFLSDAPYLTEDAARWLVAKGVKAVVYDFPEEREVRDPEFDGKDFRVHQTMLGNDIYNIEYVINLSKLSSKFVTIVALPIPLANLDGAPARVLAFNDPALLDKVR